MDNEKNLTAKETFALAVKNHKKNNIGHGTFFDIKRGPELGDSFYQ